jgi:hypothetical protein
LLVSPPCPDNTGNSSFRVRLASITTSILHTEVIFIYISVSYFKKGVSAAEDNELKMRRKEAGMTS